MATPKYDNLLYLHTKALLNKALPMEWTIRALQKSASGQYPDLLSINSKLHNFWLTMEFSDLEILDLELLALSWDALQVGKPTSRSYTKVVSMAVVEKVRRGVKTLLFEFNEDVSKIRLPEIAKDYRYFDLLNGNDIPKLLNKVHVITERLGDYNKDSSIPFQEFAIFMRTPTRINNDCIIQDWAGTEYNGKKLDHLLSLSVRTDIKINSFEAVLNEFILEYCNKRKIYLQNHPEAGSDNLPDRLITQVLNSELFEVPDPEIDRHDGLIGPLVGLYYWERAQVESNVSSTEIYQELHDNFNIDRDDSTIRKDYKATRKRIEELIYKSCSSHKAVSNN